MENSDGSASNKNTPTALGLSEPTPQYWAAIRREIEESKLPSKSLILDLIRRYHGNEGGITLSYSGKKEPWQIARLVKPKVSKILKGESVGPEPEQARNLLVEGENLSAMVTIYKYRGQVDLIVTDPPYNADRDFRYNDKWDTNPDDPGLGDIVLPDDGSKHCKWLRFMAPRLYMMKEMLRAHGVIAICIDHRELYRLGVLMDEIFGERNRIGIINWQKSYSPKSDSKHLSTATEYVLVYAKDIDLAKTGLEARTEKMDSIYLNPDDDLEGRWFPGDITAASGDAKSAYGIQSPFTGEIHYPKARFWSPSKDSIKKALEKYGSEYEEKEIGDGVVFVGKNNKTQKVKALVLKGVDFKDGKLVGGEEALSLSRQKALGVIAGKNWPELVFNSDGSGGPKWKRYLSKIKQGKISMTFWANEEYDTPLDIDNVSWGYQESGASRHGINELDAIVGQTHGFETVKPLKLIKKIIQLWCKPDGLILDPFAGSGTTGQAVLELNQEACATRRFILIEQGNTDKGDDYAKTLTAERLRRTITGNWASGMRKGVGGGFRYIQVLGKKVDANAVVALAREEMIDILTTSYWNMSERAKSFLTRTETGGHLFATNSQNEGFFLAWGADGPQSLTRDVYSQIAQEAKANGLARRFHVYAASAPYVAQNVEFYKIPDKVLEHLGFDASGDASSGEEE